MANAVDAKWHGDDYQARFFWICAAQLRNPETPHVIEVTFEGDGPKSFDDVIVRYDPPRRSAGPNRVSADFHQIKWHVTSEGRFGFADLADPSFVHAKSVSLLQRLADAKGDAPADAAFTLITTDRIRDDDPLGKLVSKKDGSLRLDRLKEGVTERSEMGAVRALWRSHLGLESDEQLYVLLQNFHIQEGHHDLESLRKHVNQGFRLVGLISCDDAMEFRFDGAAKALKTRGINRLTRQDFETLCAEEGWIRPDPEPARQSISIRSFGGVTPADMLTAADENSLSLLDMFDGRRLVDGRSWEADIKPAVSEFVESLIGKHSRFRVFLDAHISIGFLAGRLLGPKSGASVEIVQKGQRSPLAWHAEDGLDGPAPAIDIASLGAGKDIALAVGLTHDPSSDVNAYIQRALPSVGKLISIVPTGGPGHTAIAGGTHASRIADAVAGSVTRNRDPGATIHIFAAAPNAFVFMLGQRAEQMGECVIYEFDFGGRVDGSYNPSMRI